MMAEELRLLYVAMTRAKEKLILSVALTGGARGPGEAGGGPVCCQPPPWRWPCSQSVGHWVLLSRPGPARRGGPPCRSTAGLPEAVPAADSRSRLGYPLGGRGGTGQADSGAERPFRASGPPDESETDIREGRRRRPPAWRPGRPGTIPTGRRWSCPPSSPPPSSRGGRWTRRRPGGGRPAAPGPAASGVRPRFAAEERGLTPAQRGTALHLAMQYHPLRRGHPGARGAGGAEIARLVRSGPSSPPSRGRRPIRRQLSAAFLASPLGQGADGVRLPCAAGSSSSPCWLPAADCYPQAGAGEEVLLQGVVDCLVRDSGGHHRGGLQERPGVPVAGQRPGREEYRPSARGLQPGPGGDHREAGGPPGALVLRTGELDPAVEGRQKGRWTTSENFSKKQLQFAGDPVLLLSVAFTRRGGLLRRLIQNEKEVKIQ